MDGRDLALLAVVGYVAVRSLVRLMTARHQALLSDLRREIAQERQRQAEADEVSDAAARRAA